MQATLLLILSYSVLRCLVHPHNSFIFSQEASLKLPLYSSSPSTSSSTWLTPVGHSMIVSGYDIGSLASAAIHIAGYTPSFSNSFKVLGDRSHGNAHPAPSSYPTGVSNVSSSSHSDSNNTTGTAVKTKNTVRENMRGSMKADISGLRIVKCCESDIIGICRMESSSGSSPSIRTTTATAEAEEGDKARADDSASISLLCLDTEEGVFAYFPDDFPALEGDPEGQRGTHGDTDREKEIEKEEKDKDEEKGRRDRDNEDEEESEEEEDNWRDRESEVEEDEEEDDEDDQSSSEDNEKDGHRRSGTMDRTGDRAMDRTRDKVSGNRSDTKRDRASRRSDRGSEADNVLTPALGSLFKLVTPTPHGLSIGECVIPVCTFNSHNNLINIILILLIPLSVQGPFNWRLTAQSIAVTPSLWTAKPGARETGGSL